MLVMYQKKYYTKTFSCFLSTVPEKLRLVDLDSNVLEKPKLHEQRRTPTATLICDSLHTHYIQD